MSQQQILPTWLALNAVNSTSSTYLTDLRTGQAFPSGGLNVGDYFDLTEQEANQLSYTTTGLLHWGRYRYLQVSSGATAANVKAGTIGYAAPGSFVQSVQVLTQGTGQTTGTYTVAAAGGGGTGATIQVVVSSATAITATVLTPGTGYTSTPTFTLVTGGTPGTVVAQMNTSGNIVTSADIVANAIRPVIFLNSITPGSYGFVQEEGLATVLSAASIIQAVNQFAIATAVGSTPVGYLAASSATASPYSIGSVIDPLSNTQTAATAIKVLLNLPAVQD